MTVRLVGEDAGLSRLTGRARDAVRLARGDADMTGGIDQLVAGFVNVVESFPDLAFATAGGTLELARTIPEVTCVRIGLPAVGALRLASVLIDADEVEDLAAETTRRATSLSKGFQHTLEQGLLFDPDNTATAVSTARRQQPRLEITFDRPVTLRKIQLRNVADGELSLGNRGIQVLVRSGEGVWNTIYDGVQRERTFVHAVERRYAGQTLPQRAGTRFSRLVRRQSAESACGSLGADAVPIDRGADLIKILTELQLGDYRYVESNLRRVDLDPDQLARFRAGANTHLLAERKREWSLHGIKRTFRFWSEQEKQDYVGFAVDVVRCLQDLNENASLGFGTVLGLVRDHDLIPHDDDADVVIGFEPDQAATLSDGRKLIKQCLQDHGYIISKDRVAHYWVESPGIRRKLDAFAGIFEGDRISWYPGKRGVLTRQMMFPPTYIDRFGHSCPVPRETERYLETIYGPDWKTPDPNFRHAKSETRPEYASLRHS